MLSTLSIKNFAIIDDVSIDFNDGFSALTGETGAGKSIIMEAVNLLLGSRASSDLVRTGCRSAELEAFFRIGETSDAAKVLQDHDIDASEGLIIRRIIPAEGSGRVFINSRQSTVDLLKQVTKNLAGISSQHAHQTLLKEENHLDFLDHFAGTEGLRNEVRELYHQISPLQKKIKSLKEQLEQNQKEQDFLNFQINEISDADIAPEEDEILEKQRLSLLNASKTFEIINSGIYEAYDREDSVFEKLSTLLNELEKTAQTQEGLGKIIDQLSSALFDIQDIVQGLRAFSDTIDLDPASLEETEARLDRITRLKRKYGGSLDALFKEYGQMKDRVFQIENTENQIRTCEDQVSDLLKKIELKALQLSSLRQEKAIALADLVGEQLAGLEMNNAVFKVDFSAAKADGMDGVATSGGLRIGRSGLDRVCFLLSPNPGEAVKPLAKIASGGELSRIVLALKAVLTTDSSLETLIFDEVDAGIGGATSEKVGRKLKLLAQKHQVICITHLAQIAKYAHFQYKIFKQVDQNRTFTTIVPLDETSKRIEEIARMIGGSALTSATLTHAKELLEKASS